VGWEPVSPVEIGGGRKEEKSLKTTNNHQVLKIKKLSWSAKEMVLSTLFELSTTYLDQTTHKNVANKTSLFFCFHGQQATLHY
jgi:hypothetical protein